VRSMWRAMNGYRLPGANRCRNIAHARAATRAPAP